MNVTVIGTGRVGLVVGACLAEHGNRVVCVDIARGMIEQLNRGEAPFFEPGLDGLIEKNRAAGRLSFTTGIAASVQASEIIFIAVGTPANVDGSTSLQCVWKSAEEIAAAMNSSKVVVMKSTVPVGTCERVAAMIRERGEHAPRMVMSPEFLAQGSAVRDFMSPRRIVVGTDDQTARDALSRLFSPLMRTHDRMLFMDIRSAELAKYAANAMLAVRVSMMNDLANLSEKVGADIDAIRRSIALDERIGRKFLFAGAGYGGSCLPKDMQALIATGRDVGHPMQILEAAERVNQRQRRSLATRVLRHFDDDVSGRKFAIWGLSFKPRTDDIREAPAVIIIRELLDRGARIVAYDPRAMASAKAEFGESVDFSESAMQAVDGADALLLTTEWNEFRSPDFDELKQLLKRPLIFDGRNVYDPVRLREMGFVYYSIGRP